MSNKAILLLSCSFLTGYDYDDVCQHLSKNIFIDVTDTNALDRLFEMLDLSYTEILSHSNFDDFFYYGWGWLVGVQQHFQHKNAILCHVKINSLLKILISDRNLKYVV